MKGSVGDACVSNAHDRFTARGYGLDFFMAHRRNINSPYSERLEASKALKKTPVLF